MAAKKLLVDNKNNSLCLTNMSPGLPRPQSLAITGEYLS